MRPLTRLRRTAPVVNPCTMFAGLGGSLAFGDRDSQGRDSNTLTGSGAVRYQPASGARINLVKNPSAEVDTTGWIGSATITRVTSGVGITRGSACLQAVSAGGNGGSIGPQGGSTGLLKIASTVPHTVSFDAALISGDSSWVVGFIEYDANSNQLTEHFAVASFTIGASPARFSATLTPNQIGTHYIKPYLLKANSANASTIQTDAWVLETGTITNPTYFDGSTSGAAWLDPITGYLGTAHASPSVSAADAWPWEGVTNTIPDPSFENATITNYWTAAGSATISKVSTHAKYGTYGGKVSCTASTSDGIDQLSTSGAAALTAQVWTCLGSIRAFASGDVGKTVKPIIVERASDNSVVATNTGSAITLTDAWQDFAYTVTLAGGASTAKVTSGWRAGAATAVVFVLDGVDLVKLGYATPHCDGDLGTGHAWVGTAHASASTRTAATFKGDETHHLDPFKGAIKLTYYRAVDTGAAQTLFDVGDGTSGKDRITLRVNASDQFEMGWTTDGGSEQKVTISSPTIAVGSWVDLYAEWHGAYMAVAIGTGAKTVGTRDMPKGNISSSNDLAIGSLATGTAQADGRIGGVFIAADMLTDAERAKIVALGTGLRFDAVKRVA